LRNGSKEANAALEKERDYAILEAQRATYCDASKLVVALNRVSRSNPAMGFFIEGIIPLKKHP
jgi:hypothetical protein